MSTAFQGAFDSSVYFSLSFIDIKCHKLLREMSGQVFQFFSYFRIPVQNAWICGTYGHYCCCCCCCCCYSCCWWQKPRGCWCPRKGAEAPKWQNHLRNQMNLMKICLMATEICCPFSMMFSIAFLDGRWGECNMIKLDLWRQLWWQGWRTPAGGCWAGRGGWRGRRGSWRCQDLLRRSTLLHHNCRTFKIICVSSPFILCPENSTL